MKECAGRGDQIRGQHKGRGKMEIPHGGGDFQYFGGQMTIQRWPNDKGLAALLTNKVGRSVEVAKRPCWAKHLGSSVGHPWERLTAYTCTRLNENLSWTWVGKDARRPTEGLCMDRRFWQDEDLQVLSTRDNAKMAPLKVWHACNLNFQTFVT